VFITPIAFRNINNNNNYYCNGRDDDTNCTSSDGRLRRRTSRNPRCIITIDGGGGGGTRHSPSADLSRLRVARLQSRRPSLTSRIACTPRRRYDNTNNIIAVVLPTTLRRSAPGSCSSSGRRKRDRYGGRPPSRSISVVRAVPAAAYQGPLNISNKISYRSPVKIIIIYFYLL